MNVTPIHHTITNRIPDADGGGWEFWCAECSYRVRYTHHHAFDEQQLQIVDPGDPTARHTGGAMDEPLDEQNASFDREAFAALDLTLVDDGRLPEESFDEQTWLTPEIRATLERIVARLDL